MPPGAAACCFSRLCTATSAIDAWCLASTMPAIAEAAAAEARLPSPRASATCSSSLHQGTSVWAALVTGAQVALEKLPPYSGPCNLQVSPDKDVLWR